MKVFVEEEEEEEERSRRVSTTSVRLMQLLRLAKRL